MTDYQRLFVDNIIEDVRECCDAEILYENELYIKLESRIEAYDNERREQYIKALSESLPRLVSEVI